MRIIFEDPARLIINIPEIIRTVQGLSRRHQERKRHPFFLHIPQHRQHETSHISLVALGNQCGNADDIVAHSLTSPHIDPVRVPVEHGYNLTVLLPDKYLVVLHFFLKIIIAKFRGIFRECLSPEIQASSLFFCLQIPYHTLLRALCLKI